MASVAQTRMLPNNNFGIHEQHRFLLGSLQQLYMEEQLCDVIINVESHRLHAHRVVLAASSKYFRAMFMSGLSEDVTGQVTMHEIDPMSMKTLLDYMYMAKLDINNDNVQSVFVAASLLEMLAVCEVCAQYMALELNVYNAVEVFLFASLHSNIHLMQASQRAINHHFTALSLAGQLNLLDADQFTDVLRDDELNVRTEEEVFDAVMSWIEWDLEKRSSLTAQLLSQVRLSLLQDAFMESRVMTSELVMTDTFCKAMVINDRTYKLLGTEIENGSGHSCKFSSKLRLGMYNAEMLVFVGGSQDRHSRALTGFDPATCKNYYAIQPHVNFDYKYRIDLHRIVITSDNRIYLAGGIYYEEHHLEDSGAAIGEVKMFNPDLMVWEDRCPLLQARCGHVLIYAQQCIYAMGGKPRFPQGQCLSSVEMYDPKVDQWRFMSSMPTCLALHNGVVHDNSVLVAGGQDEEGIVSNRFFQYHIETDHWTEIQRSLQTARAEFGMVLLNDKVFVIGGTDGTTRINTMEVYDLLTGHWSYGADFPEERKSMATVVFDGCIYVCGGSRTIISRQSRQNRVVENKDLWKYDPGTGFWTRQTKLVQYANIHACVVGDLNTRKMHESDYISKSDVKPEVVLEKWA